MYKGYRFIDSDGHVLEPPDIWERYLEPRYREEMPDTWVGFTGQPLMMKYQVNVGEYKMPQRSAREPLAPVVPERTFDSFPPGLEDAYVEYARRGFTAECYREALEKAGIDYMVAYPTAGLQLCTVPRLAADTAAAYRRAYNNWLYDFCTDCGGRVLGAAAVDLRDPQMAAEEARRCVQRGFKAVMINPEPVTEHRLNDPFYDPLWQELVDLDVPLGVHAGAYNAAEQWVHHYFPDGIVGQDTITFSIGNMLTSYTLIMGGVLERHPSLRVVHLESGAGWAAFWLDRMQAGVAGGFRFRRGGLSLTPVEYFQRQCYISADPDDPGVRQVVDALGDDNIVTATDFGHVEGREYAHAVDEILAMPLAEDTRRKVLWDNAARLYGL
jgi:predicted TIM-barrel fold metal-dependent hydrolase